MSGPLCPTCKASITKVRPVRIITDPDTARWKGRVPSAIGFVCPNCDVLLPLSPTVERDDA